jgi:hypothetical protein
MKRLLMFVLALFVLPALAGDPLVELDIGLGGEIIIEPDGQVRSYTLDDGASPAVADLVRKNVATWRFEPIVVEGNPVVGKTRMSLSLTALQQANGNYLLKLNSVFFGGATSRGKQRTPRYPTEAVMSGVGARVLLVLRLDPQGNVVDIHPYQTSLTHKGSDSQVRTLRKRFESASMAAARHWKYVPGENIGGTIVESTVIVPIVYHIEKRPSSSDWTAFVPGPISPAPWVDPSSVASVDADQLQEGAPAGVDSHFRLKSDVIGKTL